MNSSVIDVGAAALPTIFFPWHLGHAREFLRAQGPDDPIRTPRSTASSSPPIVQAPVPRLAAARGDCVLLALCGQPPRDGFDVVLPGWEAAGLEAPTKARVGHFHPFPLNDAYALIGTVSGGELRSVRTRIAATFE